MDKTSHGLSSCAPPLQISMPMRTGVKLNKERPPPSSPAELYWTIERCVPASIGRKLRRKVVAGSAALVGLPRTGSQERQRTRAVSPSPFPDEVADCSPPLKEYGNSGKGSMSGHPNVQSSAG